MYIFLQVAVSHPTSDWFTHKTSLSTTSMPPGETTKINVDTSVAKEADEDSRLDRIDGPKTKSSGDEVQIKEAEDDILLEGGRDNRIYDMDSPKEVTSENLWERTEVLAGEAVFPL